MTIKNNIATVCFLLTIFFTSVFPSAAMEIKDEAWIRKQAFKKASEYARSISCDTNIHQKNLVALVPCRNFNNKDERERAKYALIWHGDEGCMSGSGSYNPYIVIVGISHRKFVVYPSLSSPAIDFEVPVHVINESYGDRNNNYGS